MLCFCVFKVCLTSTPYYTLPTGNFVGATFYALANTYGFLSPDLWTMHPPPTSPMQARVAPAALTLRAAGDALLRCRAEYTWHACGSLPEHAHTAQVSFARQADGACRSLTSRVLFHTRLAPFFLLCPSALCRNGATFLQSQPLGLLRRHSECCDEPARSSVPGPHPAIGSLPAKDSRQRKDKRMRVQLARTTRSGNRATGPRWWAQRRGPWRQQATLLPPGLLQVSGCSTRRAVPGLECSVMSQGNPASCRALRGSVTPLTSWVVT